ncbi:MAG: hypothetical protein M3247_08315 [Thermoproteota archaeon]|nr:hypothetical protein [Thermoproteota archaeon]
MKKLFHFLTSSEFQNTKESLMIQPSAASAGVNIREFVMPYNSPAAIEIPSDSVTFVNRTQVKHRNTS